MLRLLLVLMVFSSEASVLDLKQQYLSKGGSAKAFAHLECAYKRNAGRSFRTKPIVKDERFIPRCNILEGGTNMVSANRTDVAVIVDYTKKGSEKRLFIIDGRNQIVTSHYVSHGSFRANIKNRTLRQNQNSLDWVKYFSNEEGSNASPSGLFITGKGYQGIWKGPKGDKYSMVLHGIEPGVNDMSCERTIVMHGNQNVRERGFSKGAREMSHGCFMVDYNIVNQMVGRLMGTNNQGGAYFFAYGPREAEMDASAYCR